MWGCAGADVTGAIGLRPRIAGRPTQPLHRSRLKVSLVLWRPVGRPIYRQRAFTRRSSRSCWQPRWSPTFVEERILLAVLQSCTPPAALARSTRPRCRSRFQGPAPARGQSFTRRAVRNSSTSAPVVVASCGSLSSRRRPVNRGKRIASPCSGISSFQPAVWLGETVSSALSTSSTIAGSNHTSADTRASTRAGFSLRRYGASRPGSSSSCASEKPVPHRPTVR